MRERRDDFLERLESQHQRWKQGYDLEHVDHEDLWALIEMVRRLAVENDHLLRAGLAPRLRR